MEYFLNELQKTVKQMARTIAQEKILPVRAELDEKEEFPWSIIKDLADTDLLRVFVPEELINKMAAAEDKAQMGIEIAASLAKELKDMCQGVHIMAIGWEKKVPAILEAAGL